MRPSLSMHLTSVAFVALVVAIALIGMSGIEADLARNHFALVASAQ